MKFDKSPKSPLKASRRTVLAGMAATGAATMLPRASRAAGGKVVVGTWGGDYQNLQQKHVVAPIMDN